MHHDDFFKNARRDMPLRIPDVHQSPDDDGPNPNNETFENNKSNVPIKK